MIFLSRQCVDIAMVCVMAMATPSFAQSDEAEQGPAIDVSLTYTGDVWSNVSGGIDRGTRYLDDLGLVVDVDGEQVLGMEGVLIHGHLLYNNGQTFSDDLVGDAQVISNIEAGTRAIRLYEAWIDKSFGDHASIRLGLYDLNSEFDANETGSLFINSSHGIGPDFSQSGDNGPSIFPNTSLAVRTEVKFAENWRVRAAVLDAVPGNPNRPKRTSVRLSHNEGALLIGEIEYRATHNKFVAGVWHYTNRFETLDGLATGHSNGAYALLEQQLTRESGDAGQGLSGWLRAGFASTDVNRIAAYFGSGLVYTGWIKGRDADRAGVALGWVEFGRDFRHVTNSERREVKLEFTYEAVISDHISVQPDLQLIFSPSGDPALNNAVAIGLRTTLSF